MNLGGTEKALLGLLNEIDLKENEVTVLLLEKKGELLNRIPNEVKIKTVPEFEKMKPIIFNPPHYYAMSELKKKNIFNAIRTIIRYIKVKLTNSWYYNYIEALKEYPIKYEADIAVAFAGPSDFISIQAASLNMESFTNQPKINSNFKKRVEDYIKPPVEDWLACFRDADYVITDSFHGTVFSILYKKPFISIANKMRGAARFESILKQLGLEDRLLNDINDFDPLILSKEIDYDAVSQKLVDLRRQSIDFLRKNLS